MITCSGKNNWSLLQKLSYETNQRLKKQALIARQLKENEEHLHEQILVKLRAHRKERIEFVRKNFRGRQNALPGCKGTTKTDACKCISGGRSLNNSKPSEVGCFKDDAVYSTSQHNTKESQSYLFEEAFQMMITSSVQTGNIHKVSQGNNVQKSPSGTQCMLPNDNRYTPNYEDRSSASAVAVAESPHSVDLEDSPQGNERQQEGRESKLMSFEQDISSADGQKHHGAIGCNGVSKHQSIHWLRTGTPPLDSQPHTGIGNTCTQSDESVSPVRVSKHASGGFAYATCTTPIVLAAPVYSVTTNRDLGDGLHESTRSDPVCSANAHSEERARPVLLCNPFFVSYKSNILQRVRNDCVGQSLARNVPLSLVETAEYHTESHESDASTLSPAVVKSGSKAFGLDQLHSTKDSLDATDDRKDTMNCVPKSSFNTAVEHALSCLSKAHIVVTSANLSPRLLDLDASQTRDSLELASVRLLNGKGDPYADPTSVGLLRSPRKSVRFTDSDQEVIGPTSCYAKEPASCDSDNIVELRSRMMRTLPGSSPRPVRATGPVISVICSQSGLITDEPTTPNSLRPLRTDAPTMTCGYPRDIIHELPDYGGCSPPTELNSSPNIASSASTEKVTSKPPIVRAHFGRRTGSAKSSPSIKASYASLFIDRSKAQHRLVSSHFPSTRDGSPLGASTLPFQDQCTSVGVQQSPDASTEKSVTEPTRHTKSIVSSPHVLNTAKLNEIASRICKIHQDVETSEVGTSTLIRLGQTSRANSEPDVGRTANRKRNSTKPSGQGDHVDFQELCLQPRGNQNSECYTPSPKHCIDHPPTFLTSSHETSSSHSKCAQLEESRRPVLSQNFVGTQSQCSSRSTFTLGPYVNEDGINTLTTKNRLDVPRAELPPCDLPNIHAGLRVGVWRLLRRRPRISEHTSYVKAESSSDRERLSNNPRSRGVPVRIDATVQTGATQIADSQIEKSKHRPVAIFPSIPKPTRSKCVFSNPPITKQPGDNGDYVASLRRDIKNPLLDSLAEFVESESACCQTDRAPPCALKPIQSDGNPEHYVQSKVLICNGVSAPSAISIEEARLLQSLEKLNTRLCVILSDRR